MADLHCIAILSQIIFCQAAVRTDLVQAQWISVLLCGGEAGGKVESERNSYTGQVQSLHI